MTGPDPAGGTTLDVFADVEHTPGFVDFARLAHPPLGVVPLAKIGLLRHGTDGGRAVVMLVVELPDGRQVVAQTTWRNLRIAVHSLEASPIGSEETL